MTTEDIDNRLRELFVDMPLNLSVAQEEMRYYRERYELLLSLMFVQYGTVNESNGEIECTFYPEVHHAARGMVQRIQKEREENWEAKTITASFYYEGVDGFYLRSKYAAQFAEDNEVVIEELKKATNQATFGELRKNDA